MEAKLKKILIVDDEALVREDIKRALLETIELFQTGTINKFYGRGLNFQALAQERGYSFDDACSVSEAVDLIKKNPNEYVLITLDGHLDDGRGEDVLKKIPKRRTGVVIGISNNPDALRSLGDSFLRKSYLDEKLPPMALKILKQNAP